MINKRGFTLAEVLITIGILGVIAAVTLPALNTNIVKSNLEVQTRKFYTQFSKAFDLYKVDNDTNTITGMDFDSQKFIRKYFNVSRQCTEATDCYAATYQNLDGKNTASPTYWFSENTYELADGSVFTFEDYQGDEDYPLTVIFDVNGKKGPNKIGYDLWTASVFYDGSVDEGGVTPEIRKDHPGEELDDIVQNRFELCKSGSYGGCLGHFKRNNFKFDY